MKMIKNLSIEYSLFLNNFKELKKIEIKNLTVYPIVTTSSDPEFVHLNSQQISQNEEKIKKFLLENNLNDPINFDEYKFIYNNIQYSYLMYLYKENKLKLNDPILLNSNRFMYYLITQRDDEISEKDIKNFEKIFLKDEQFSYRYAINVLRKPWKELEESDFYFNKDKTDIKFQYLVRCVIPNINLKNTNKHYVYVIFDYLINNPIYKHDLDSLLSSKNLIEMTLKDFFQFHYLKQLDEYMLKNHPKNYGIFYYFLYNSYFNQKLETYNLNEVMKKVREVPAALVSVFQRFQNNKQLLNEFLEDSETINKNMLKDLKTLASFLNFVFIKKQKYFFNFMDNNSNIIKDIFKAIEDEAVLSEFMIAIFKYYSQDIEEDDFLSDAKKERFKEIFQKRFPETIKKISQYSKSAINYAINIREQFIEGEEAIFKVPIFKEEYLRMLKKLGPTKVKNYDHYDFSIIK